MTRVDFYVLETSSFSHYVSFVCRLTEKVWRQGHDVFILCADRAAAVELDERLWTYRDVSFVPHALLGDDEQAPVTIGFDQTVPANNEVLVNLASTVPTFFSRFERVVETTGFEPDHRHLARERYRYYQERGYALETHNIAS